MYSTGIGALIGSFLWPLKDAPRFAVGFGYCLACCIGMFVLILGFHVGWGRRILRENEEIKSKEIGGATEGPIAVKI